MNIEKFLHYYIPNLNLVIEILFVVIVLTIIFLAVRSFLGKDADKAVGDLSGIEEPLKKVLEQNMRHMPHNGGASASFDPNSPEVAAAGIAGASSSADAPTMAAPPGTPEEQVLNLLGKVQNLERELKEKEQSISKAAASGGGGAPSGVSTEEKKKLEERIRELEGRLSEYEIIEEDIADLSHYKEENKILSDQLTQLRGQLEKANKEPAPGAATAAATETPKKAEPQIVERTKPAPTAAAEAAPAATDPVVDEFSNDLKNQKMGVSENEISRSVPEGVAQVVPEVVGLPEEPAPAAAAEPASDDPLSGSMNLDRMMEEAQGLGDGSDSPGDNALEQQMDESKLLAEAAELGTENGEQDEKLMNQFENFVEKKG